MLKERLAATASTTERLFQLLAASHGQQWNASNIGRVIGLTYHTVNAYVNYLEGAFLLRRLPAYHTNVRKQFTKRPKIYWRDSGLLHSLWNISSPSEIHNHPMVGASWEGHVVDQVLTALQQAGRRFRAFYLRTVDGHKIDLILNVGQELWAIESKLTTNPSRSDIARLNEVADIIGAQKRFLVNRRAETYSTGTQTVCDLAHMVAYAYNSTNDYI